MSEDLARGRGASRGRRAAMVRRFVFVYLVLLGVLVASSVFAQGRRDSRLTGVRAEALTLRTPRDRVNLSVQFDDAIQKRKAI